MAGRPLKAGCVKYARSVNIRKLHVGHEWREGGVTMWRWNAAKSFLHIVACPGGRGPRPMFECPKCQKRFAILYEIEEHVACRICFKLHYEGATLARIPRFWRKRERIEAQIAALHKKLNKIEERMFSGS